MAKTQINLESQAEGSLATLNVNSSGSISGDLAVGGSIKFADGTAQSSAAPQWAHYSMTYNQLSAASFENSINLSTLNPKEVIHGVVLHPSVNFSGGSLTGYTLAVGISGDVAKYLSYSDVYRVPADNVIESGQDFYIENVAAMTTILLSASSSGTTLNQASQGSVDIWLLTSNLP